MAPSLTYRRLRTPSQDGGILLEPSWHDCLLLLSSNSRLVDSYDFELYGRSFQSLRESARAEMLKLAKKYTSHYADPYLPSVDRPIVMSGHQPQLIHPGVWAKHFAVHQVAAALNGVAVQVIIDSDLMRSHSVQVPTGSIESPRVATEVFDRFKEPQPFETRRVSDPALFASFAHRVANRIESILDQEPLVKKIWQDVVAASQSDKPIGQAFAQGRHKLELDWGQRTIEVPLSQLCETVPFRRFMLDLLLRGKEVRAAYNRRLGEYRRVHRLRNATQPLPDLQSTGDWTESPFWIWNDESPFRQPLWWRRDGATICIGSPNAPSWTLDDAEHDPDHALEQLDSLSARGLRVRPRAIATTVFARLFLSDLFIHGIGGAKYDQITDPLVRDLYSIEPPAFVTLSLTTLLPVAFSPVSQSQIVENQQELRRMHFHPERFLDTKDKVHPQVSNWIERKATWIKQDPARGLRKERHRQIAAANAKLREFLQEKPEKQRKVLAELGKRESASQVWSSREWSFVLFPEVFLKGRLLDLSFENS